MTLVVFQVTGDNLMTAVSVVRECNMVCSKDKVIVVEASPPSKQGDQQQTVVKYHLTASNR